MRLQLDKDILALQFSSFKQNKDTLLKRNELLTKIPEFWCRTLRSHPMLSPYFDDIDTVNAMNYCTNVFASPLAPPQRGFTVAFVCTSFCLSFFMVCYLF